MFFEKMHISYKPRVTKFLTFLVLCCSRGYDNFNFIFPCEKGRELEFLTDLSPFSLFSGVIDTNTQSMNLVTIL